MRHTKATKRKLSKMRKGENNPFYGRKHSEESKRRISEAGRNRRGELRPHPVTVTIPPGDFEFGYFCGLLDGEGSIRFRNCADGHKRPFVAIYNSDEAMMQWLLDNVGGRVSWDADGRGRVPVHHWRVQGARDVAELCRAAIPYLIAKSSDASEALSHLVGRYGEEVLFGENKD